VILAVSLFHKDAAQEDLQMPRRAGRSCGGSPRGRGWARGWWGWPFRLKERSQAGGDGVLPGSEILASQGPTTWGPAGAHLSR